MNCMYGDELKRIQICPMVLKMVMSPMTKVELIKRINEDDRQIAYLNVCQLDLDCHQNKGTTDDGSDLQYRTVYTYEQVEEIKSILKELSNGQSILTLDWLMDDAEQWYMEIHTTEHEGKSNIDSTVIKEILKRIERES